MHLLYKSTNISIAVRTKRQRFLKSKSHSPAYLNSNDIWGKPYFSLNWKVQEGNLNFPINMIISKLI